MADSDGVLTQEQIDAMLSGGTIEPAAQKSVAAEATTEEPVVNLTPTNLEEIRANSSPPAAAAAAAAAAAPPPAPGPAPATAAPTAAPAADNGAMVDLANRVASLEATVSQGAAGIQGILAQLQELSSKVEGMMTGMQGTVGYSARQTFVCSSCQNQGHVAAKLNCTACGEDNWWGWWPPQPETPPAP